MAEKRCELTELPVAFCAHCRGHKDPEQEQLEVRAELLASGEWFAAQYKGRCDGCGVPFAEGAAIRLADRGWRAECCAEGGGDGRG